MKITLLDGGMGQELVHRTGDRPTALWSGQVMVDHPGIVQNVHWDFFDAGATVATTNTYALHHDRLEGTGLEDRYEELFAAALNQALGARTAFGSGRIAGSIGPLIASYRPDIHPGPDIAIPKYTEAASMLAPFCDLILCETVSSLDHARSVLKAAATGGIPVWLAVSVNDADGTRLRSGEPLADVLPVATEGGAEAILANCSSPEAIGQAMPLLAKGSLPYGGYANGFTQISKDFLRNKPTVDALTPRRDLGPEAYAEHAMSWVAEGATIVGGCCEVGPVHIATLAHALRDAGHTII